MVLILKKLKIKQLNYLNKEPANYDIFAVHPDSIVAPIKSKKLNGMLPTQGWSEKYIDPANKKVIYEKPHSPFFGPPGII